MYLLMDNRGTAETADGAKDFTADAANKAGSKAKETKDAAADTVCGAADVARNKAKSGKDAAVDTGSGSIINIY